MSTAPFDPGDRDVTAPDVTGALATLVADEPPLRTTVEDAERLGRSLLARRRRRRAGAAGGVLAAGVAALLAGGPVGQLAANPAPQPSPSAAVSSPDAGTGIPDGTMLPVGFPVSEAFAAVQGVLPAGAGFGEIPQDVGWRPAADGTTPVLEIPLVGPDGATAVARLTLGDPCTLTGARPVLRAAQAGAAADAVCATWESWGSPDPLAPVPSPDVPPDPAS